MKATSSIASLGVLLLLVVLPLDAQVAPIAVDCGLARFGPPYADPRHQQMHCFNPWAFMRGQGFNSECEHGTDEFGRNVMALDDINHDDLADFAVERLRCELRDAKGRMPQEWYVYYGVRGGIPDPRNGQRIAPREDFAETRLLTSGDWDADGSRDLLAAIRIIDGPLYVCVFWGTPAGVFSIDDTTRLEASAGAWATAERAVSADIDGDRVDDVLMVATSGVPDSALDARTYIYRGHRGARWGTKGMAHTSDAVWWNPPRMTSIKTIDQDCDGNTDILFLHTPFSETATLSVLYGRSGALPDTATTETAGLATANGYATVMADVTGDRVPEVVTKCGTQDVMKVFAGRQGQRLRAMIGTGDEPGKPWHVVKLPGKIDSTHWSVSGRHGLYDLGDANRDGISDVWSQYPRVFTCYVAGDVLDSAFDAAVVLDGISNTTLLGDIDGSGQPTFALGYGIASVNPGVAFFHTTDSIPVSGMHVQLPHDQGFVCEHAMAVDDVGTERREGIPGAPLTLDVTATPNPATEELTVRWRILGMTLVREQAVEISLVDAAGTEVLRRAVDASQMSATFTTSGIARGWYLLVLRFDIESSAVKVHVR